MQRMRLRDTLTLLWIFLLVPITLVGAWLAYTQGRERVAELNEITPSVKPTWNRLCA
ncbi:MAG: hypothetical protein HC915_17925 [Anaerolineae bacterium]|nr:hypothetical protein [Anaerolineae bacterium]